MLVSTYGNDKIFPSNFLFGRIDKVEEDVSEIKLDIRDIKDDIKGIKADLSTTVSKKEFNQLKNRVDRYRPSN